MAISLNLRVSVLIPVYNEVKTLPVVIQKVLALSQIFEVVVVDDGSRDGTREFLSHYKESRVKVVFHESNQGKTAAIRTALQHATGEVCIIQDADLEYNPDEIPAVLMPILEGRADVVYGSRFLVRKESRVLYYYHFLANKFLTFLSNLLTNLNMTDIETGYKAFKTFIVKDVGLSARGFGMEVEITALLSKISARIYEVPISYYGRTYDEGKKIGIKDGIEAIWYILYYNLWYFNKSNEAQKIKGVRSKVRENQ